MFYPLITLTLAATALLAQIDIPPEFSRAPSAAAVRMKAKVAKTALERPLWMSLAGKHVLGNRAHVVVQLADKSLAPAGLRLLEPLGGGAYVAGIDLTSPLGIDLLAGRANQRNLSSVVAFEPEDKLDATLLQTRLPRWAADESGGETVRAEMLVSYHADVDLDLIRQDLRQAGIVILDESPYFQHVEVRVTPAQLRELSKADWVQFIEPSPSPPQTKNNATSAKLIGDDTLQADPFSLTGRDINIGIFDGGSVAAHIEFADRLTNVDRSTASPHSTHVAGTMIAAGNDPRLKGMAPAARLYSWTYQNSVPTKMERGIEDQKISVANNSWGEGYSEADGSCGRYGTYGTQERDYDRLVREKNLSIVFAAGNDRDWGDCTILPRGGFYTIGRPATAKNIISVGAVEARSAIADFSSAGPMRDNRIKPDIVAMGVDVLSTFQTNRSQILSGTSMATPAISGTAALLVERYQSRNDGQQPNAALVKAALLNTAKDLGNIGPDYVYGYGLADAVAAVKTLDDHTYVIGQVQANSVQEHFIDVPGNTPALRVMLAYSDADAVLTAASVITNHLELVLASPDGSERHLPLRLSPANPMATAVEREGDRDNVKQAVVMSPAAGVWKAEVRGAEVLTDSQEYVVAWNFAESPVPPCLLTLSSPQTMPEKGGIALITVTTGNHCESWSPRNLPEWARVTGPGTRQGTDLFKVSVLPNGTGAARTANIQVGDRSVKLLQTFRCQPEPIAPGQTIESALSSKDCFYDETVDAYSKLYTFEAKQDQAVNITLRSNAIDTLLLLLAPNGELFSMDDDGLDNSGTNSRIPFRTGNLQLPVAGTYTIVVTTFDADEVGPFDLRLEFAEVVGITPVAPTQISGCPATVTGTLTDASTRLGRRGDLYPTEIFQFPGRVGQEVLIEATSSSVDTFLYLISPAGKVVDTGTDIDGSGAARVSAVLREAGTFSIEVSSFSPFSRGEFILKLEGCTRP